MKTILLILTLGLLSGCAPCMAMGHWEALSQIESGDNDQAIGKAGEVSRYQVMPAIWGQQTKNAHIWDGKTLHDPSATNKIDAGLVALEIMVFRLEHFYQTHHRSATDAEWYLLWSCPSRVDRPSKFKAEVATRFANLCADAVTREGRKGSLALHTSARSFCAGSPNVGQAEINCRPSYACAFL